MKSGSPVFRPPGELVGNTAGWIPCEAEDFMSSYVPVSVCLSFTFPYGILVCLKQILFFTFLLTSVFILCEMQGQ